MPGPDARPTISSPPELRALLDAVRKSLHPSEIWMFGSRARNDHRPDSDWDLLAVLPDDAPEGALDPVVTWEIVREARIPATLLSTTARELKSIWGLPNTIGYDLAREGLRISVD